MEYVYLFFRCLPWTISAPLILLKETSYRQHEHSIFLIFYTSSLRCFLFVGKMHTSLSYKYTSYLALNVPPSGEWSPTLEKQLVLEPSLPNSLITSVKGYHSTFLGAQNLPIFLLETKSHLWLLEILPHNIFLYFDSFSDLIYSQVLLSFTVYLEPIYCF